MIEDILDMMRHDATISEEQLQAVSKDPEAIESCRDILYARRIHRKGELPDVEMQLSAFKKQHLLSQKVVKVVQVNNATDVRIASLRV